MLAIMRSERKMLEVPTEMAPEMKDAFEQFARNGRWGTCGGCPRDVNGRAIPELCANTKMYDHNQNLQDLIVSNNNYLRKS
jgi:succinate dehydrogenase/fumarate reductase-like Fe-S protein